MKHAKSRTQAAPVAPGRRNPQFRGAKSTGQLRLRHPRGLPPSTGRITPVVNVKLVPTATTA